MTAIESPRRTGARPSPAPASLLFLQGPIGPFFSDLARRLSADGSGIHRIHLCGGDSIWWSCPGSTTLSYRGRAQGWPDYLRLRMTEWDITDLLLFGDCRPMHQEAIKVARMRGVRVHVFEEGYLRPHWVTLERDGVNRHSSLPRDPEWYRAAARRVESLHEAQPVPVSFSRRALEDVIYTFSMVFQRLRFPFFRTHKPWHPLREYVAGAKRFPFKKRVRREADALCASVIASGAPYYLWPLQLHADAQIRFHSPFGDMATAIRDVIASFAKHAPAASRLVVTEHPLDNGVIDLRALAHAAATASGVADRVVFIPGGSPDELMRRSRAVVTINSTIGMVAIGQGKPLVALGDAIYALRGLVFQGGLDAFWTGGTAPDPELYEAFRRVVIAHTQVNGGFYSAGARRLAVEGAARRIFAAPAASTTTITPVRRGTIRDDDAPGSRSGSRA